MNVYTPDDLEDLARLREEVERLKQEAGAARTVERGAIKDALRLRAERDEAIDCLALTAIELGAWKALAREAAGELKRLEFAAFETLNQMRREFARGDLDDVDRPEDAHAAAEAFLSAHPELVE
jgi:hypothetical protein